MGRFKVVSSDSDLIAVFCVLYLVAPVGARSSPRDPGSFERLSQRPVLGHGIGVCSGMYSNTSGTTRLAPWLRPLPQQTSADVGGRSRGRRNFGAVWGQNGTASIVTSGEQLPLIPHKQHVACPRPRCADRHAGGSRQVAVGGRRRLEDQSPSAVSRWTRRGFIPELPQPLETYDIQHQRLNWGNSVLDGLFALLPPPELAHVLYESFLERADLCLHVCILPKYIPIPIASPIWSTLPVDRPETSLSPACPSFEISSWRP